MNDQPTNSAINPAVRAGLDAMMRHAVEERSRHEAGAAERRRIEAEKRERDAEVMRRTVEAFRMR